jgi:AcrR family transcriptional regulator
MAGKVGERTISPMDPRVVRTRNDILRTTLQVLTDEGWEAVTHQHVAQVAGYSKATVYNHWRSRADLIRDAFMRLSDLPHHVPTGDLRTDLIQEVTTFRTGLDDQRLARALCVLVTLADPAPELDEVRNRWVADGERLVRELLTPFLQGTELEAATLMLCGAVLHSVMMRGEAPGDDVIASAVDLVLRAAARH